LGISQEKLAELTDVSTQTINNIECCRSWVGDNLMLKLAEALGIEVFQLFVPDKKGLKEDASTITAALLRLRQDIKSDFGVYVDSRFSRFLSAELPAAPGNGTITQ
jgi:transcriptional regulator with XRE-family HTH domain